MRSCLPVEIVSVTVYRYGVLLAMERALKTECIASEKESWGSGTNKSGNKCKTRAVGIEEWRSNVICSIIQRPNNKTYRCEIF